MFENYNFNHFQPFLDSFHSFKTNIPILQIFGQKSLKMLQIENKQKFLEKNNWSKIQDVPKNTLSLIVQFHISKRNVIIADLTKGKYVPILYKERELFIDIDNPKEPFLILGITKANILNKDNELQNGMVNKIDNVLSL